MFSFIWIQGFIQALYLTSVFAFKIEVLWPIVIEQRPSAPWEYSWGSKGISVSSFMGCRGAKLPEAFTVLVSKHAQTPLYGTFLGLIRLQILCFWRLSLKTQFKIEIFFSSLTDTVSA